jgi:hypothetical protein
MLGNIYPYIIKINYFIPNLFIYYVFFFYKGLLTRVTLDQAIFAPCFITTFFVGQALLEGQENSQILEKLGDVNIKSSQNIYLKDIVLLKLILIFFYLLNIHRL